MRRTVRGSGFVIRNLEIFFFCYGIFFFWIMNNNTGCGTGVGVAVAGGGVGGYIRQRRRSGWKTYQKKDKKKKTNKTVVGMVVSVTDFVVVVIVGS